MTLFLLSILIFFNIDGGGGIDTLKIDSSDIEFNLINSSISEIEKIDLTGLGDNSLILNKLSLINNGIQNNGEIRLIIEGNIGDSVVTLDNWDHNSTPAIFEDTSYNVFEVENFVLLINPDIDTSGII